jgi:hypothetical protein
VLGIAAGGEVRLGAGVCGGGGVGAGVVVGVVGGVVIGAAGDVGAELDEVGATDGPATVVLSSPEEAKTGANAAIRAATIDAPAAIHALLVCLSNQLFASGFSSAKALITPLANRTVEVSSP